jgi:integrase
LPGDWLPALASGVCRVKSKTIFTEPKTRHSVRTVTLPQSLVADVRAYLDKHPLGQPGPDNLLFCEADGSPILHWRRYSAFKRALIAAGIDPTVRLHDLRHTCASLLIAQGVDAKVIQVHLGHASYGITMDRYGHLYPDATAVVGTALDAARGVANTRK